MDNGVANVNILGEVSTSNTSLRTTIETYFANFSITAAKIKFLSAFAFGSFFGCGLRSAYRHTKGQQLSNIRSGFALGLRALGIATVLSVSGVGLLVVAVSIALNVDSPRQFGQRMTDLCGDRFRISRGESISSFAEILEAEDNSKKKR